MYFSFCWGRFLSLGFTKSTVMMLFPLESRMDSPVLRFNSELESDLATSVNLALSTVDMAKSMIKKVSNSVTISL